MVQNALAEAAVELLHCKCKKSSKQMLAVVERQDLNAMMLMYFSFLFLNVTIQIIIFYCIHGGINEKEKQF